MRAAVIAGRVLVALLSAVVLVAAGYGWSTLRRVQESVNTTDVLTVLSDVPNAPPAADGATDILLVGTTAAPTRGPAAAGRRAARSAPAPRTASSTPTR